MTIFQANRQQFEKQIKWGAGQHHRVHAPKRKTLFEWEQKFK